PEEIAWLAASVLIVLLLGLVSLYRFRNSREHSFAVANGVVAAIIVIVTLPLVSTGFSFVTLRIGEYTNLIMGPFAAATLIRMAGASTGRWSRLVRRVSRNRDWLPRLAVCLLAAAVFMGGNLAGSAVRPYFEEPSQRTTDSPLYFTQVNKFVKDRHLAVVFEDGTFTIYRVMALPPP